MIPKQQDNMRDINQSRIQSFAFVISVCIAICLSFSFISNHTKLEPNAEGSEINLESRINPNLAPIASLVRLPDIGLLRAGAIVTYREQFGETDSENKAFKNINDLQKVKGIGPKTVQNINEWLTFE